MTRGKQSPKKLKIAERRRRVVALRKAGCTLESIALQIQKEFLDCERYTAASAYRDVQAYIRDLEEQALEDCREMRILSSERLEAAMLACYPSVTRGDYNAVDRWIKLISEYNKLWGLYLPPAERPMNQEFATSIELELIT